MYVLKYLGFKKYEKFSFFNTYNKLVRSNVEKDDGNDEITLCAAQYSV